MDFKQFILIGALSTGVLTGCGSDSNSSVGATGNKQYTGVTAEASINSDNQSDLATSSIEVTKSLAVDVSELNYLPFGVQINQGLSKQQVKDVLSSIVKQKINASNLPTGVTETEFGNCGGSVTGSGSDSSFTVTFKNFCESEGSDRITINGVVKGSISATTEKYTFNNVTISIGSVSSTVVGTSVYSEVNGVETHEQDLSFTSGGLTVSWISQSTCSTEYPYDCTYTETFTGSSGTTYKVEDYYLSSDVNGWDITGPEASGFVMYDPSYGSLNVEAYDLVYCGEGSNNFLSGEIVITDSSGVELNVDFLSCGTYGVSIYDPSAQQ